MLVGLPWDINNSLTISWIKSGGLGTFNGVTLTFPINLSKIFCVSLGAENPDDPWTSTVAMTQRGALRSVYKSLTNNKISVQSKNDVYILILGT